MFIIILLKTVIYLYINSFSVICIWFQFKTLNFYYIWNFNILILNLIYLYIKLDSVTLFLKFSNICNLKVSKI